MNRSSALLLFIAWCAYVVYLSMRLMLAQPDPTLAPAPSIIRAHPTPESVDGCGSYYDDEECDA